MQGHAQGSASRLSQALKVRRCGLQTVVHVNRLHLLGPHLGSSVQQRHRIGPRAEGHHNGLVLAPSSTVLLRPSLQGR